MTETGKKVEVRYGTFACRVEGFDDPVEPLREVLGLMQRIIAETPALADLDLPLDDAHFARIGEALAGRGTAAAEANPGIIVIRGNGPAADEVEEARIVAGPDRQGEESDQVPPHGAADARPAPERGLADTVPHPSAAIFAAPAAAAAEAAFAASVASGADPDRSDAQGPLEAEEPGASATPAALFAAPGAGTAEAAFATRLSGLAGPAGPADPDDDAEDSDLASADETAGERAAPGGAVPVGADPGATAHAGAMPSPAQGTRPGSAQDDQAGPAPFPLAGAVLAGRPVAEDTLDERLGAPDPVDAGPPHAPPGTEPPRPSGGPGEGWAPWQAAPGVAPAAEVPPSADPGHEGHADPAEAETGAAPAAPFREPDPPSGEAEDAAPPTINIFAYPLPETMSLRPEAQPDAEPLTADPEPEAEALTDPEPEREAATLTEPEPEPVAAPPLQLRHDPQPQGAETATAAGPSRPDRGGRGTPSSAWADADLGDGDWPEGEDEADPAAAGELDAEPPVSAENRLAALITRYQSRLRGHTAREAAPVALAGAPSAAELAARAGAAEVDDLLLVSAAWLTLAEGRPQVTRREVMEVFETLPGSHARTLEARIKGFGSIVRAGALQRVDEGTFSLAPGERARFRSLIDQG